MDTSRRAHMSTAPVATDQTSTHNLRRLFVLRSVAIPAELTVLLIAIAYLHIELPLASLLAVIALHTAFDLWIWRRLKNPAPVTVREFFVQLTLDVLLLTALLYFTGGPTNPFVSFFLLPLVITAALLPPAYTWLMAALTIVCYTLLMFFHMALPHMPFGHASAFDVHVIGMWIGFLLGAALIVFVVARMANTLRERDRVLARTREQLMRDDHMVAMGMLATGAAHELGTPLATMAVLARELQRDHAGDLDVAGKAAIFREQLERCKDILSDISATVGKTRAVDSRQIALDEYLEQLVMHWRTARAGIGVVADIAGSSPAPYIVADRTLTQALTNILNNAADASPGNVAVTGRWNDVQLTFTVADRGAGMSADALAAAGTATYTTKAEGHGVGLLLARAVIDRHGGSLQWRARAGGGTSVTIVMPLARLAGRSR